MSNEAEITSRIIYKGKIPICSMTKYPYSERSGAIFHRIDYHDDGSISEYYGIEIDKQSYENFLDLLKVIKVV